MPNLKLPRVPPGLILCYGIDRTQEAIVRAVIEHDIRTAEKHAAVRLDRKCNVQALHAGLAQAVRIAGELAESFVAEGQDNIGEHCAESIATVGGGPIWAGAAGRSFLSERLEGSERLCITFSVDPEEAGDPRMLNTLAHLAEDAENSENYLVGFIHGSASTAERLLSVAADAIEISACVRDPGAAFTFEAKSVSSSPYHALGLGHVMCNVSLSTGKPVRIYQKFVSADLSTRFMWLLSCQGLSDQQIGALFGGMSRTTVTRRLQQVLLPRQRVELTGATVEKYAVALGLDTPQLLEALDLELD